jgi:hypothetical protein
MAVQTSTSAQAAECNSTLTGPVTREPRRISAMNLAEAHKLFKG